ncbi:MAG: hypothetical protein Q4A21_01785 [bacterium]|nr:hypothetical protein [bacterium]
MKDFFKEFTDWDVQKVINTDNPESVKVSVAKSHSGKVYKIYDSVEDKISIGVHLNPGQNRELLIIFCDENSHRENSEFYSLTVSVGGDEVIGYVYNDRKIVALGEERFCKVIDIEDRFVELLGLKLRSAL